MRVSFHRKASSMRRIYGVGEISKIIPTFIVVSTIVPPATQHYGTALCQQTTDRSNSGNSRVPIRIDGFVHLTRRGPWLVTDLGAEDLWYIGNTRQPPIYCALPRPARPFTSHFPPSTLSIVSSLRLEPFILSFFRSYISTVARFSLPLFLCFSSSLLFRRTPILPFPSFLFIFISIFF